MISLSIVSILLLGLTSLNSYAKDPSELVEAFCYALQVSMFCDDLKMGVDTEGKIEKQLGTEIRGPKSPYNKDCLKGLNKALDAYDAGKTNCLDAWEKYGCSGSEVPRLIQRWTSPCAY